jgi:hypothetical protein
MGKSGEILGLGERRGFTKSPLIPKPLVGENTVEVNKGGIRCQEKTISGRPVRKARQRST